MTLFDATYPYVDADTAGRTLDIDRICKQCADKFTQTDQRSPGHA